jgi:hypothetical protein
MKISEAISRIDRILSGIEYGQAEITGIGEAFKNNWDNSVYITLTVRVPGDTEPKEEPNQ